MKTGQATSATSAASNPEASPSLLTTLRQHFGFDAFRPGQEEAVRHVLAGQNTLLVMPTGSGKSLAYQFPALLLPGLTLVISPLIALMKDQVDALLDAELPATFINSSLPRSEQTRRLRAMREGNVKLIYIAPERLRSNRFVRALTNVPVSLLAVDEAHCVSQWGHDFRPDYLQIRQAWEGLGHPPLLATTATATPKVQSDILRLLGPVNAERIVTGFDRPNLSFEVHYATSDEAKLRALRQLLEMPLDPSRSVSGSEEQAEGDGSVIIYVATRRAAEEIATFARDAIGLQAEAYHAGLDPDIRHRVQNAFMDDRLPIVVATNAFGMGVNKADIRWVIHYHIPATVEAYYQEAGRAGRDSLPARCALFFSPDDLDIQTWFIDADTPALDDLRTVHRLVERMAKDGEALVSRDEVADITGMNPAKVRITLSELEQAGTLLHLGDEVGFSRWRVLSAGKGALEERARVIAARADHRHQLLAQMIAYAGSDSCRRRYLLDYFGDDSPPEAAVCCDNCRAAVKMSDLPPAKSAADWIPLIVLETIRTLPRPIGRVRLAQILRGSQAQAILRMGYDRHKFHGKLGHMRQKRITAIIDTLIETRHMALTSDRRPVLVLTPTGLAALEARIAIPLSVDIPAPPDPNAAQRVGRGGHSATVDKTLTLHRQGLSPPKIAEARGRSLSTIYGHLSRLIADGKIEMESVVTDDLVTQIQAVVEELGAEYLAPIKQRLPDEISYGEIRCVIAGLGLTGTLTEGKAAQPAPGEADRGLPEIGGELPGQSQARSERPEIVAPQSIDETLFEVLCLWRTAQAGEQGVPPYIVFHDRVLRAIATSLPTDPEALRAIPGIGPVKLKQYGDTILAIVRAHSADVARSSSSRSPRPEDEPSPPLVPEEPADVILSAVADLPGLLSRSGLAKLLTGSPSNRVASYQDHSLYGALHADWGRQELTAEIDRLIARGYLVNRQGRLVLSPTGQAHLQKAGD
jgi:ATP-dependent DNA helicase RecQ